MTDHPAPPVAALKPYSYERHGLLIEDPYHWLRDPKYPIVDDPEILAADSDEGAQGFRDDVAH